MKVKALVQILFGNRIVNEGEVFEPLEQHGRELILKGYASLVAGQQSMEPVQQQEVEQPAPETSSRSRSK